MALGKQNFSLMSMVMAMLVILSRYAEAHGENKTTSIFCRSSKDPEFCETLVQGANSPTDATNKAIKASIVIAKMLKPYVNKFIESLDMPPNPKKTIAGTCHVDYEKVIDNYAEALNHLKKGNKGGLAAYLSKPTLSNCVAHLNKYKVEAPVVRKAKSDLEKYMKTCAMVAKIV